MLIVCFSLKANGQAPKTNSSFLNDTLAKIAFPTSNERWIDIKPEAKVDALNFFKDYGKAIGLGQDEQMNLYNIIHDNLGYTHYCYNQYYRNIRIENGQYNVHVNKEGVTYAANGALLKGLTQLQSPVITRTAAFEKALSYVHSVKYFWEDKAKEAELKQSWHKPDTSFLPTGELVWTAANGKSSDDASFFMLAYTFDIHSLVPLTSRRIMIDAQNGNVLKDINLEIVENNPETRRKAVSFSVPGDSIKLNNYDDTVSIKGKILQPAVPQSTLSCPTTGPYTAYFNSETGYTVSDGVYVALSSPYVQLYDNCRNIRTADWNNDHELSANPPQGADINPFSASSTLSHFGIQVHWALTKSFDFYQNKFGRNGFNGNGAGGNAYVNAYFDQPSCGNIFYPNTSEDNASFFYPTGECKVGSGCSYAGLSDSYGTLDIIGHEFTHGVTGYNGSSGLDYNGQSGALNESFSDIFGEVIEWYVTGTTSYLHGYDRYGVIIGAGSLHLISRSLKNPNDHSQPDTYGGTYWYTGTGDHGGVHTNSGVQNYMFYLLAEGGSGTNDNSTSFSVSGIGISDASKIAYRALTGGYLTLYATYADARKAWVQAAADLFGYCSNQVTQTQNAWTAVGVAGTFPASVPASAGVCDNFGGSLNGPYSVSAASIVAPGPSCSPYATTISTSTPTSFIAGTQITLLPGFHALSGCNFSAFITTCSFLYWR